MVEKFSDFEGNQYLSEEGQFIFTVEDFELKDSSKGSPMAVFNVKSDKGSTTIYHSLNPKARWSYNKLIECCLKLTDEQKKTFELDYETIGAQLVGKMFIGNVEQDVYKKPIKVMNDDGTFTDDVEEKITYKIVSYERV